MKKILVANRGEIALRIMRSCREMGIKTVAVFSEADRKAPFVKYADEAVFIGTAPSSQSYLNGDKIIEVCKMVKADGIHPGYGFLSENSVFCSRVNKAGIIFIGPTPKSMQIMGDKLSAKAAAKKFNIPLVPGSEGSITDISEGKRISKKIGFPVLIKASAGGGGKGMRIVFEEKEFEQQMKSAISEAKSSFGNGDVFIEKYVSSPRHIEVQILADSYGNVVHLFERECSVQRRHQKVIEEAPSSVLTREIREQIGKSAVEVAKSCNYLNAGTVEFILDENKNFFFLEMNTRLQVEHPVTELITGVDLVKEQIRIAMGEKISFKQDELKIQGHAVEVRVYAEDPLNNFLPDIGKLETYRSPKGIGVRVDDGFEEGMDIPIYYDPMISKLITHGKDRDEAINRMIRAIDDYKISGVETTLGFCKFVLRHPAFTSGNFDTHFVQKFFNPQSLTSEDKDAEEIAALVSSWVYENENRKVLPINKIETSPSKWKKNR